MVPSVGDVFGNWTVVATTTESGRPRYVACRCACGNAKEVYGPNLMRGLTASCGCARPVWNKGIKTQTPEGRRQYLRDYAGKSIDGVGDWYVKLLLSRHSTIPFKDLPDSLVELKRQQIVAKRLARELRKAIDESSKDPR